NALPNYGQIGYVVAMNADLTTPGSDPAPTPVPAPTGAGGAGGAAPAVGLARKTAQVSGGRAALEILCQAACSGEVTLQRTTAGKAARATKSLGRAKFSGEAGKAVKVRVKLNSRGKALLKTKRKASVQASFTLTGAATPTVVAVTLRR
ncbi:MAG: hypothetical protein JHD16_16330, partial [Solirubrobacteraceae bacterium]|nr:hypothetical protein [Solirubrobacteraceae bacterium]